MRHVFNTEDTIKMFLSQTQQEGHNHHKSVFFEGKTIYSYGQHYPMATLYIGSGQPFVLVNCNPYSVTTAKHRNWTVYNLKYNKIYVPSPKDAHDTRNIIYLKNQIKNTRRKFKNALIYKEEYYTSLINCFNAYRQLSNYLKNGRINSGKPLLSYNSKTLQKIRREFDAFKKDREKRTINDVLMSKPLFKKIQKKTLKPNDIFKEKNTQRRGVLLGLYTYERLLKDTNSKIIHKDGDYELFKIKTIKNGQVLRETVWDKNNQARTVEIQLPEDITLLKVKCPSTGAYFVLRVPPDQKRCKQALAWTFDMSEKTYQLEMET